MLAPILCSLIMASFASTFLGGCRSSRGKSDRVFYYNEVEDLNTLDPARTSARAPIWAAGQIFVGLVGLDSALNPIPMIARAWDISADGKTWTFHLRNDVSFTDDQCFAGGKGRHVTAEDVRFSFERICDPATASSGFFIFREKVVGAESFYTAKKAKADSSIRLAGFRAIDDSTFQLALNQPSALVLSILSMPFGWVVPHEAIEKYGKDFMRHPVGAGPYRLVEWKTGQSLVLARNPTYFERDAAGKQLPYLDSVVVSFISDKKAEFGQFQDGNLDMAVSVDPAFSDKVFSPDGKSLTPEFARYHLFTLPSSSVEYYAFLLDSSAPGAKGSPFVSNRYLRRALNYGIDREAIVRYVLHGNAVPATHGPIPPGIPGYSGVEGYRFDKEKARALLDSAGYPGGAGLPAVMLEISESDQVIAVAQAVQEQLNAIGVHINVHRVSPAMLRTMRDDAKLPFWRANWMADYPDAENFISLFYSKYSTPTGSNSTRFNNAAVDSLYLRALDPSLAITQRAALYGQAERIILDEAPWILLYHSSIQRLTQPAIQGYTVDPLDRLILTRVSKKQA